MQAYTVTGQFVTLHEGLVDLTDEQVDKRGHALEPFEDSGLHRIVSPVGFKRGETFGYEGPDLGSGILSLLNGGGKSEPADPDEGFPSSQDQAVIKDYMKDWGADVSKPEIAPVDSNGVLTAPPPVIEVRDQDGEVIGQAPAEMTVGELMEDRGLSFDEARALLADYEFKVNAKKDVLPYEVVNQVYEDFSAADSGEAHE